MSLLNRLTIKNLKLNKHRTIVTIIGIMLSMALITAVASMFFAAKESLIEYEISQKGNYHYSFRELTVEEASEIEQNRKVEETYLTSNIGYAILNGIQNEDKPYLYVKSMTTESMENLGLQLKEGRLPENENEVLIPSHLKTNGRVEIKVGETITLDVGTRMLEEDGTVLNQSNPYFGDDMETLVDTETKEYTVVGIVNRPATEIEGYTAPGYTAITYMDQPAATDVVDVYARYTKDGLKERYQVTAHILGIDAEAFELINSDEFLSLTEEEQDAIYAKTGDEKYDYGCNSYLIQLETGFLKDPTLASLASACVVVVIIIIFTSVFCIKNSFDISITEKIRQYGMLSSVGATRKQIKRNVYFEAVILGVIGIPLGLLLGHLASFILCIVTNKLMLDLMAVHLSFSFSLAAIVAAVVLGFATLLLSARQSARKASKVSPIQAIRNSEEIKISSSKVKSPKIIRRIFGVGGEIAHKNLKRSKKKYRTTVISITVCVTVFVALSSFVNMGYDMIKTEFAASDYNISMGKLYSEDYHAKSKQVRGLEGINQMSNVVMTTMECHNGDFTKDYLEANPEVGKPYVDESGETKEWTDSMNLVVLDEETFREYVKELHLDYDKVKKQGILSNVVYSGVYEEDGSYIDVEMDKYTFKKGDVIEGGVWEYSDESKDIFHELNVEIGAVTDQMPFGVYTGMAEATLLVNEMYLDVVAGAESYEYIFIDAADPDQIQDEIEKIYADVDNYNLNNLAEDARAVQSVITLVGVFLYGFIIVISLIGVTNIFNTITTNMNLRRREFAMLKSVGMTRREFNHMVMLESFFYGVKSLIIGLPLGCVLSVLLYHVMTEDMMLQYHLPVRPMILSAVAVFVLITCIMRFSVGKIGKQNIIETIRNENI